MKKLCLFTATIAALTTSAIAADLSTLKEPIAAPPPPPMWTGLYAGLNAGGGFGNTSVSSFGVPYDTWSQANDQSEPSVSPWHNTVNGLVLANSMKGGFNQSGVIGGIQFGYNHQFGNNIVVGGETDFQGSGMSGNRGTLGAGVDSLGYSIHPQAQYRSTALFNNVSSSINWFATVRGRLGYLIAPTLLVYASGGLTYAGVTNSVQIYGLSDYYGRRTFPNPQIINKGDVLAVSGYKSISSVALGWNVGGGLEYMLNQSWSIKTEAFYYNLGGINIPSTVISGGFTSYNALSYPGWGVANNTNVSYNGVIARAGINYHINFVSPPVIDKF